MSPPTLPLRNQSASESVSDNRSRPPTIPYPTFSWKRIAILPRWASTEYLIAGPVVLLQDANADNQRRLDVWEEIAVIQGASTERVPENSAPRGLLDSFDSHYRHILTP